MRKLPEKRQPEYVAWMDMRSRCNNKNNPAYPLYGGRGIRICERWDVFLNFLSDMWLRPDDTFSLDRIDVNVGYTPANCRWAARDTQDNNKQNTKRIAWSGEVLSRAQWERKLGLTKGTLRARIALGWSLERVMTEPVQRYRPRDACKNGHPWTDENVMITTQGSRMCRMCYLAYQARYNAQKR